MFKYCDKHDEVVISWIPSKYPNGCPICHGYKLLAMDDQIIRDLQAEVYRQAEELGRPGLISVINQEMLEALEAIARADNAFSVDRAFVMVRNAILHAKELAEKEKV